MSVMKNRQVSNEMNNLDVRYNKRPAGNIIKVRLHNGILYHLNNTGGGRRFYNSKFGDHWGDIYNKGYKKSRFFEW